MNTDRSIIIILYSLKFIFGFWRAVVMKSKKPYTLAINFVLFYRSIIYIRVHAEFCRPAIQLVLFQIVKARRKSPLAFLFNVRQFHFLMTGSH